MLNQSMLNIYIVHVCDVLANQYTDSCSSPLLWTHAVFAVLYFIIGGLFFIQFVLKHEDIPIVK